VWRKQLYLNRLRFAQSLQLLAQTLRIDMQSGSAVLESKKTRLAAAAEEQKSKRWL